MTTRIMNERWYIYIYVYIHIGGLYTNLWNSNNLVMFDCVCMHIVKTHSMLVEGGSSVSTIIAPLNNDSLDCWYLSSPIGFDLV